ncbi:hypothetical protein M9H77_36375 [Catharanthus roseus]|uniref:Uncharacterized protein n=1 Tax=Catharanthus roseus TaxID=4058 RepID=A0ACB9ZSH2_CATRO|nr:hypothetical protein M9H77_36375 [Catharanthus roseus]
MMKGNENGQKRSRRQKFNNLAGAVEKRGIGNKDLPWTVGLALPSIVGLTFKISIFNLATRKISLEDVRDFNYDFDFNPKLSFPFLVIEMFQILGTIGRIQGNKLRKFGTFKIKGGSSGQGSSHNLSLKEELKGDKPTAHNRSGPTVAHRSWPGSDQGGRKFTQPTADSRSIGRVQERKSSRETDLLHTVGRDLPSQSFHCTIQGKELLEFFNLRVQV